MESISQFIHFESNIQALDLALIMLSKIKITRKIGSIYQKIKQFALISTYKIKVGVATICYHMAIRVSQFSNLEVEA